MKITRLTDIIPHYLENYPNQEVAFGVKRNGQWEKFGIQEYAEKVDNISYGLLKLGVERGDKVGIISGSRPEWNMLDMATMQIGAISVPIYPTISQADYKYVLNHAEIKIIFIEGKELRTKITPILPEVKSIKHIYTFINQECEFPYLELLVDLGKENQNPEELTKIKNSIQPDDLATIIYTSGTTGDPKGVMLSHNNIVHQILNIENIPSKWSNTALSFLPLCHAYERMLVYLYQYLGMSVYYAESLATIADNIKEVNPTMMSCVPRLLEKIYDKLYLKGKELSYIQKVIYYWAFRTASKYQLEGLSVFYKLKHHIADKLIYKKWREGIGGNFDIVVSGGSAIPRHIASFFSAIGMPVFEGYGLSETSPVIAVSQRGKNGRKFGTVGPPLPGVEVKLGVNDEILCRGHNVMIGYYKDEKRTKEVIDSEGWFHTGDKGEFTKEGQLKITGRIKNIFKTSLGKYINPEKIEEEFCKSPLIDNMMVVGENRKFAAALISPDFVYLQSWCNKNKIPYTSDAEIVKDTTIIKRYQKEVKEINDSFGDWEQIKKFELIADEWSQKTGLLTPTLKLKRNVMDERYAEKIEKLFA